VGKTRTSFWLKMLTIGALGFAAGVPFYVIKDLLKAQITEAGLDLGTIGLFTGVGFPFAFKFIWAPAMDRYEPLPLGRRRAWMLLAQIALAISIMILGQFNPHENLMAMAVVAVAIAFFHASHDIAVDAHRREFLETSELAFGSGLYMNVYRGGSLAALAIGFYLAGKINYATAHIAIGFMMIVGALAVFFSIEPKIEGTPPKTLKAAAVEPLKEFFRREGAITILLFFLLYKIGDNMASAMNLPFILKAGFDKMDYLYIAKGVGMVALFAGMFAGGALVMKLGLFWSLISFGVLQMISTAAFALLDVHLFGKHYGILTGVVVFELLTTGLGTAAYATFMALQTNKRFTATQYALFTSLMAVPVNLSGMVTGYIAQGVGWIPFYMICAGAAIPGLLMIPKICPRKSADPTSLS
jgi:MFS transporter, PAT family, beta-lactamase induction signal transducer AmpG